MAEALALHFPSPEDVKGILEAARSEACKRGLNENTQAALESGAFGCPWFVVRNDEKGEREPFFGSDR